VSLPHGINILEDIKMDYKALFYLMGGAAVVVGSYSTYKATKRAKGDFLSPESLANLSKKGLLEPLVERNDSVYDDLASRMQ
jgi:hypothetical protein